MKPPVSADGKISCLIHFLLRMFWNKEMFFRYCTSTLR